MNWKKGLLVVLIIAGAAQATLAGRIIMVNNDGPADFGTIQAAIDDANDGDVVVVQPGTYTGDGNRDINGDCKVDFKDYGIMLLHWLDER